MDQKQNDNRILRMKELHRQLLAASRAYYQESREIMSNFEYDRLYDELLELEKETGTVLAGSPTQKVGYEVLSELPKEAHEAPMLSLDKTKEVPVLQEWLGSQKGRHSAPSLQSASDTEAASYRRSQVNRYLT